MNLQMDEALTVSPGEPHAPSGRSRRIWLVAGSVATVAAVMVGGFITWSWLGRLSVETEALDRSYVRPVSRVVVDADDAAILLLPGEAGQVHFERRLEWSGRKPLLEETWDGQTFRVTAACPDNPVRIGLDPVCEVSYRIFIPVDVEVDAATRSGQIEARGLEGDVRLSESNGSVTTSDMSGPLTLQTTSGDIVGAALRSGRVDVQVTTGDVDLSFVIPPDRVTVQATTGNPTIELPGDDRYRVQVDSDKGSQAIDVVHDPDATRVIDIRTTTGDVRIRYHS